MNESLLNKPALPAAPGTPAIPMAGEMPLRSAVRRFGFWVAVLAVLFCVPLFQLVLLAVKVDLYSHVPLMPLVSCYMIWVTRQRLPATACSSPRAAALLAGVGTLALIAFGLLLSQGTAMPRNDSLALSISAFVFFLIAAAFLCFGWGVMRIVAFPTALLFFLIPFPTVFKNGLEVFLQHSSAEATAWLLKLTPIPVHRVGVHFTLPGITFQVAEECSGIRSSFVLFITGLIGGYMFLDNPWHRVWFALVTIPLGIIRNGFRVLVISILCVYVGPEMIDSFIHHQGGPIFFVLSLFPLFGLLVLFRKREVAAAKKRELEKPA